MTRDARADADRIRTDAQAKAEDARSQAETAVRAAREEADRTIAGLSTRRDALVDQLASMQERLIGVARDLESAMDVQVTIPDFSSIKDLRVESDEPRTMQDGDTAVARRGQSASAAGQTRGRAPSRDRDRGRRPPPFREPTIVVGEAERRSPMTTAEHPRPLVRGAVGGSDAMKLDIPALDLDWGDLDEGDGAGPYA